MVGGWVDLDARGDEGVGGCELGDGWGEGDFPRDGEGLEGDGEEVLDGGGSGDF